MITSDSALDALLAKFTHCAHTMLEAAEAIQAGTVRSGPAVALLADVDALADRLCATARDVAHELGELDRLAHQPASGPVRARIERIAAWLEADAEALRVQIDRLRAPEDGGAYCDVRAELAGNAEGVLDAVTSSTAAIDTYRASLR